MNRISDEIINFLETETTRTMLLNANRLIDLLENPNIPLLEFYPKLHETLISLYLSGHLFDSIPLVYFNDENKIDDDKYFENLNCSLISNLKEESLYWEIFDPTYSEKNGKPSSGWEEEDKIPIQGWLEDDISDIYHDLKTQLKKIESLESNEIVEDGLWNLKWSFIHHWGKHCIDALRYLHYFIYDGKKHPI
ncbi:DUF5063 domain-containing protein [Leptospira bandrabouensis]|uniref:DUF5063 domain-containing protein n=1 Tax=Leptospira bandrabouensis TaxID=2484903 RepID=UPI001EE8861B|nr:DUF5063 domain-containing protein [Leptospira bandrabouensis]MCG6146607.1 DUF5063 domain-containing protein [Leptospira bandrabouensis]MCG6161939.1 DUF5063 domain-containing protein [Leptospira bandrabouensis]MCG6166188.1 DUF5063 domain-containing protein [Leptospira bandrabouensis]